MSTDEPMTNVTMSSIIIAAADAAAADCVDATPIRETELSAFRPNRRTARPRRHADRQTDMARGRSIAAV